MVVSLFYTNKYALIFGVLIILYGCNQSPDDFESYNDEFEPYYYKVDTAYINGDFATARQMLDSIEIVANKSTNLAFKYEYYDARRHFSGWFEKDNIKSLSYADSALAIIEKFQEIYPDKYFWSLLCKSKALILGGKFKEGIECYHLSKQIAERYLDECKTFELSAEIANLFYAQKRYHDAIILNKQVLISASQCDFHDNKMRFYYGVSFINNIALAFDKMEQHDSATYYYQMALKKIDSFDYDSTYFEDYAMGTKGVILGNLGQNQTLLKNYGSAEDYFKESIAINSVENREYEDGLLSKVKLGLLYLLTKRNELALNILDEVVQEPSFAQGSKFASRLSELQWKYFEQTDKPDSALKYYKKYVADYQLEEKLSKELIEYDIHQSFLAKDRDLQIKQLATEYKNQITLLVAAFIISILLLVIIWQIVKQSRQRQENLKRLQEANSKLNQSYSDLEAIISENSKLMFVVAHDLRSPLAGINGLSDLLTQNPTQEEVSEYANLIKNVSSDANKLIDGILSNHKLSNNLVKETIDLHELIQYSIAIERNRAAEKSQTIIGVTSSLKVELNRDGIWRVLNNLIHNAVKFSPTGATIKVTLKTDDKNAIVSVVDQGIGIPDEIKKTIFSGGKTNRREGTLAEPSIGIGLLTCHNIIKSHKGKIWVESEEGKGSTFSFSLPLTLTQK